MANFEKKMRTKPRKSERGEFSEYGDKRNKKNKEKRRRESIGEIDRQQEEKNEVVKNETRHDEVKHSKKVDTVEPEKNSKKTTHSKIKKDKAEMRPSARPAPRKGVKTYSFGGGDEKETFQTADDFFATHQYDDVAKEHLKVSKERKESEKEKEIGLQFAVRKKKEIDTKRSEQFDYYMNISEDPEGFLWREGEFYNKDRMKARIDDLKQRVAHDDIEIAHEALDEVSQVFERVHYDQVKKITTDRVNSMISSLDFRGFDSASQNTHDQLSEIIRIVADVRDKEGVDMFDVLVQKAPDIIEKIVDTAKKGGIKMKDAAVLKKLVIKDIVEAHEDQQRQEKEKIEKQNIKAKYRKEIDFLKNQEAVRKREYGEYDQFNISDEDSAIVEKIGRSIERATNSKETEQKTNEAEDFAEKQEDQRKEEIARQQLEAPALEVDYDVEEAYEPVSDIDQQEKRWMSSADMLFDQGLTDMEKHKLYQAIGSKDEIEALCLETDEHRTLLSAEKSREQFYNNISEPIVQAQAEHNTLFRKYADSQRDPFFFVTSLFGEARKARKYMKDLDRRPGLFGNRSKAIKRVADQIAQQKSNRLKTLEIMKDQIKQSFSELEESPENIAEKERALGLVEEQQQKVEDYYKRTYEDKLSFIQGSSTLSRLKDRAKYKRLLEDLGIISTGDNFQYAQARHVMDQREESMFLDALNNIKNIPPSRATIDTIGKADDIRVAGIGKILELINSGGSGRKVVREILGMKKINSYAERFKDREEVLRRVEKHRDVLELIERANPEFFTRINGNQLVAKTTEIARVLRVA